MNNTTIHLASALMGSGKTRSMIKGIDDEALYLVAAPKRDLCRDIFSAFKSLRPDIEVEIVNADLVSPDGSVLSDAVETIEKANEEYEFSESFGSKGSAGRVLILTQTTLANLPPYLLKSWTLILDEVPDIQRNLYKNIYSDQFDRMFDEAVLLNTRTGELSLDDGMEFKAVERLHKARSAELHHEALVYDGLLHPTSDVTAEPRKGDMYILKSTGYVDYAPIFKAAKEVHVMGNAIRKTLFYLYLEAQGFSFDVSEFTPEFRGYKIPPKMVPLISGDRFSKRMMLTRPDGTVSDAFDSSTVGWKLLKDGLDYHAGNSLLVHIHDWMKPFFNEHTYPNIVVIKLDSRGLNRYRDYHRTTHLIHGNPAPVNSQMNQRMLEMMGVDREKGLKAIRHERLIETISQAMLRTGMRDAQGQTHQTVTVVPTMGMIDDIRENLEIDVDVDTSLLREPPKTIEKTSHSPAKEAQRKATKAANQRGRERQRKAGLKLLSQGWNRNQVAEELGVSLSTVKRWKRSA